MFLAAGGKSGFFRGGNKVWGFYAARVGGGVIETGNASKHVGFVDRAPAVVIDRLEFLKLGIDRAREGIEIVFNFATAKDIVSHDSQARKAHIAARKDARGVHFHFIMFFPLAKRWF